jgi:hypothetical protein
MNPADVFDIPARAADGVAAACGEQGDKSGCEQQQGETLGGCLIIRVLVGWVVLVGFGFVLVSLKPIMSFR